MKKIHLIVLYATAFVVFLGFCMAAWDNTLPADSSVWNDAAGEIRANWDALETAFGVDLVGASPMFNVKAYDAEGDGTTDDTAEIQAALTAGAGSIVYFPEPSSYYLISSTLTVSAGTTLMGPGAESTTIFLAAASNATMFSISQADGVTITGLEINGNKTNQTSSKALIAVSQSDYCEISFCRLLNAGLQAVIIEGGTSATTSYNHVHHNYVSTTDQQGIAITAESANATYQMVGNTIEFNYVTTTGYHGIEAKHPYCVDTVIHGNSLKACNSGIVADKSVNKVTISNNIVVDTGAEANHSAITVTDGGTGTKTKDVIVTGNIIDPEATADTGGIMVRRASRVIISDNIIMAVVATTAGYDAIYVQGTDDDEIIISDNIIESSTLMGIHCAAAAVSNVTIIGNIIGDCTYNGIQVNSRALITGNTVYKSNLSGIYLADADFSIVSNNISYNNEQSGTNRAGIELNSTDDCLITGNMLFDNQGTATQSYGIVTTNASTDNIIKNNKFDSNVLGTVSLTGANYTDNTVGIITLSNDATPSVGDGSIFVTGGTTTITDFDDGYTGMVLTVIGAHSVTITDGTHIILDGGANMSMTSGDVLMLVQQADTYWYQISEANNN